mmetsp:Transcript_94417/g.270387  ORF Transcript_94417/g.270387 Transcript_94417/m.270387 type:complete len:531 (-) Transcript_94417:337-1929(-)
MSDSPPGSVADVFSHWRQCRSSPSSDGYVAALLLRSHLYLCICFGLAQGATITSITYATTFMGETVGSYCDGVFFGSFTIVSLTIAIPIVRHKRVGYLRCYRAALVLFIVYEGLLWVSWMKGTSDDNGQRTIAYLASFLGGTGFSLHWTAQSALYQSTARQYAAARRLKVEMINHSFSGIFVAIYLCFEVVCKLGASCLLKFANDPWNKFFVLFICCALAAFVNSFHLIDPRDASFGAEKGTVVSNGRDQSNKEASNTAGLSAPDNEANLGVSLDCIGAFIFQDSMDRAYEVPNLLQYNVNLQCLLPISITFGITAGFLYTYYYDQTVATYLGEEAVGIVSALSPLVSSMASIPLTNLTLSVGRNVVVFLGSLSFAIIAVLYLIWDDSQLGNWPTCLFINFSMGVGRAVWENTNKAIFADVFSPSDAPSAFAAMYMVTGLLTFASLFVFPNIPLEWMCWSIIISAALMCPGYMIVARRSNLKDGDSSFFDDDIYDADETAALTSAGYNSSSIAEASRRREGDTPAPTVSI